MKNYSLPQKIFLGIASCWVSLATAQSISQSSVVSVSPLNLSSGMFQNYFVSGKAVTRQGQSDMYLQIYNSCYGTNLRSVANPLSPSSTVTVNVSLNSIAAGVPTPKSASVSYPGALITKTGIKGASNITGKIGNSASVKSVMISGNFVRAQIPISASYTVNAQGDIDYSKDIQVTGISFTQDFKPPKQPKVCTDNPTTPCCVKDPDSGWGGYSIPNPSFYSSYEFIWNGGGSWNWEARSSHQAFCVESYMSSYRGAYMGSKGALTGNWSYNMSTDKKTLEVYAAFPGENGFCGGYYSPLMFFFTNKVPKFEAMTYFPMNLTGITYWPEKGTDVGFLVYDKNKDGKITFVSELFGDNVHSSKPYENGFEKLKEFDSNKDGKFNKKDKLFNKFAIWMDKNANGVTDAGELIPLKNKIVEINLKYEHKGVTPIADRAELREQSEFIMMEKGKKVTKKIIDVYFAPGEPRQQLADLNK